MKQTWFFDLQASYEFGTKSGASIAGGSESFHNSWATWRCLLDGTRLTVGINNLFDHDPPHSNDNFPRFIYDPTGRFVYASLTKKFQGPESRTIRSIETNRRESGATFISRACNSATNARIPRASRSRR